MLWLHDDVRDNGANILATADRVYLCSAQPSTYAQATSDYALGYGTVTLSGPQSHAAGRKILSGQINGTADTEGIPAYWAAVDLGLSKLLAVGELTDGVLMEPGQPWTLDALSLILPVAVSEGQTTSEITQDGLTITLASPTAYGQHVDDTYYLVASSVTFDSVALAAGTEDDTVTYREGTPPVPVTATWIGGVMVDPEGLAWQGFDNRPVTQDRGGPWGFFDQSLNLGARSGLPGAASLPLTVTVTAGHPKTVWFYRGLTDIQVGGQYCGCYSMVQITIYASDPGPNTIKPTGLYVAAGKPVYHTSDIDYDAITPTSIPSGATEPTWTGIKYYNKRPFVRTGSFSGNGLEAICDPVLTQDPYPSYQDDYTGRLLLGAISNSSSRNELINRIVRDGLYFYSALAFDPVKVFMAVAGYGQSRALMFLAGIFLDHAGMRAKPDPALQTYIGQTIEVFQEDGMAFIGEADESYQSGKPLYGVIAAGNYPDGPFGDNHDERDVNGLREAFWMPRLSGTAQSGGSNTIQLASDTPAGIVSPGYVIYIVSGAGAGGCAFVSGGGWNESTKTATMDRTWQNGAPNATSTYEYYNGGDYQALAIPNRMAAATAVVLAGQASAFNSPAWFQLAKRWVDEDGILNPRHPGSSGFDASMETFYVNDRCFADADGVWTKKFYDAALATWPAA